jgi:hypothetical protein
MGLRPNGFRIDAHKAQQRSWALNFRSQGVGEGDTLFIIVTRNQV